MTDSSPVDAVPEMLVEQLAKGMAGSVSSCGTLLFAVPEPPTWL
ncbi:hypothetical protein [Streptomyces lanatus]|uniref:Uncharacterized protein n=1 Tax=Streptomyces lanatus TaxID=66900 RepID=A0ABV1XZV6_9ACTN|nr:hypothetical protein [Streptomyces lanatus]